MHKKQKAMFALAMQGCRGAAAPLHPALQVQTQLFDFFVHFDILFFRIGVCQQSDSRRLYIINAQRCIGNGVQKAEQRSSSILNSSLRFTEGGREGGPYLQIQNYKDIGKDSV